MKNIAIIITSLALSGCMSDGPKAKKVLTQQGYTDIAISGWQFGCGEDDTYSTGFRAKGPTGHIVEGTVCCGLMFKGCTVRIN